MSHEVRALARYPGRSRLVLGATVALVLGMLAYRWPLFSPPAPGSEPFEARDCKSEILSERCEAVLPRELRALPAPSTVEQICLTALARGLVDNPGMELTGDACGEELLRSSSEDAVPRKLLVSFVGQLSGWEPLLFAPAVDLEQERLRSSALAEAAWSAKRVAARYRAVRDAHLAREYREAELIARLRQEWQEKTEALAQARRSVQRRLGQLLGVAAIGLLVAWRATRPVVVVLSAGRVRLGARVVSLEEVARWDFRGPSLSLTDGTRVRVGFGRELAPEDRLALDEAMEVAMGRVKDAAPIDVRALHAVRELVR
jgi:hypothetical protein